MGWIPSEFEGGYTFWYPQKDWISTSPERPPQTCKQVDHFKFNPILGNPILLETPQGFKSIQTVCFVLALESSKMQYFPVKHSNGKSSFSICHRSSKGSFSIAMRVSKTDKDPHCASPNSDPKCRNCFLSDHFYLVGGLKYCFSCSPRKLGKIFTHSD